MKVLCIKGNTWPGHESWTCMLFALWLTLEDGRFHIYALDCHTYLQLDMSVPNATHCLGTLFLSNQRNYLKNRQIVTANSSTETFPIQWNGVESIFPLRRLGIVDFWGQKNAIYGWFRRSPARRFYGLAALSKAWREMNFPNLSPAGHHQNFSPSLEFFHPLKTPSFSLWTKTHQPLR